MLCTCLPLRWPIQGGQATARLGIPYSDGSVLNTHTEQSSVRAVDDWVGACGRRVRGAFRAISDNPGRSAVDRDAGWRGLPVGFTRLGMSPGAVVAVGVNTHRFASCVQLRHRPFGADVDLPIGLFDC